MSLVTILSETGRTLCIHCDFSNIDDSLSSSYCLTKVINGKKLYVSHGRQSALYEAQ